MLRRAPLSLAPACSPPKMVNRSTRPPVSCVYVWYPGIPFPMLLLLLRGVLDLGKVIDLCNTSTCASGAPFPSTSREFDNFALKNMARSYALMCVSDPTLIRVYNIFYCSPLMHRLFCIYRSGCSSSSMNQPVRMIATR